LQHEGPITVVFTDEGQKREGRYEVDEVPSSPSATTRTPTGATKRKSGVGSGLFPAKSGAPPSVVPLSRPAFATTMTITVPRLTGTPKDITEVLANNMSNLQLLYNYCNVSKGNKEAWAWGSA
jgi:hypothetical protein